MPDTVFPIIREARLGRAPVGATLRFTIPRNGGYAVEATLFLESTVVASWQSIEILGKTTEEILLPPGLYTLQVDVAFTRGTESGVTIEFSSLAGGAQIKRRTVTFDGKKPDIGRALALLRVEKP